MSAVALGIAIGRDSDAGSPASTVRAFLIDAAVEHNGVVACRYLTRTRFVECRMSSRRIPHARAHCRSGASRSGAG